MLYAIPLPKNMATFLSISTCGCNMGHCDAVSGVSVKCATTVGEAMALFAFDETEYIDINTKEKLTWYEYPDSVILAVGYVDRVPRIQPDCYKKEYVDSGLKMPPGTKFMCYYYSR